MSTNVKYFANDTEIKQYEHIMKLIEKKRVFDLCIYIDTEDISDWVIKQVNDTVGMEVIVPK